MTDLLHRLHREAEKRGVTVWESPYSSNAGFPRDPLVIAHDVLWKMPLYFQTVRHEGHDEWHAFVPLSGRVHGTFVECVVALAEAEHE